MGKGVEGSLFLSLFFFFYAKRGGRASWGWSSLLIGRDLLLQGCHWQVMSGREIRLWRDRWLPSFPHAHRIPSEELQVSQNTIVDSLFNPNTGVWHIKFIRPFISVQEVNAILATPIDDSRMHDRFVWHFDPKCVYFVKFDYHWKRS